MFLFKNNRIYPKQRSWKIKSCTVTERKDTNTKSPLPTERAQLREDKLWLLVLPDSEKELREAPATNSWHNLDAAPREEGGEQQTCKHTPFPAGAYKWLLVFQWERFNTLWQSQGAWTQKGMVKVVKCRYWSLLQHEPLPAVWRFKPSWCHALPPRATQSARWLAWFKDTD